MTASKQQPTTVDKSSFTQSHVDTGIGCYRAKTHIKKSAVSKTSGQSDDNLIRKDSLSLLLSIDQAQREQFSAKGSCLPETASQLSTSTSELESGQKVPSFTKIKMQLFPMDEITRKGLERDGHNPYLELTLSNRKKISSVLKHLKSKWDTSNVALGNLMLFPFSVRMENLAAYRRWTLEETDTTADVYASIGSPNIFRLRYGWISILESDTSVPCMSSQCENTSQFRNNMDVDAVEDEKQPCETVGEEHVPTYTSSMPNSAQDEPISLDKAMEPTKDTSSPGHGLMLSSSFWTDSFTNISIGGLLSEASLQATANRGDLVRAGSVSSLQQTPFSCDSFDAAVAAYLHGRPQGSHQLPQASQQSILDAEETCHAFSHQKLVSSKDDLLSSKWVATSSSSQDADSKLFKFPNPVKVNGRSGTQISIAEDPKVEYPLNKQTENNNVRNNLGTMDISPFTGGDSLSLGGLLGNSLDTWYNCIKDGKIAPT